MRAVVAETTSLKAPGIEFARSFQTAFRVAAMYSVDHPAAEKPLLQAFTALGAVLKQTRQFTFGFVNQRLMLNKLLTQEATLANLQAGFSKRGIGAIAVAEAVTMRDFKRLVSLLSTKATAIADQGGVQKFLAQNPLQGFRVIPVAGGKDGSEDTVLGMEAESLLTAQAILEPRAAPGRANFDALFQAAGKQMPDGFTGSPKEVLNLADEAVRGALTAPEGNLGDTLKALTSVLAELTPDYLLGSLPAGKHPGLEEKPASEIAARMVEDSTVAWAVEQLSNAPKTAEGLVVSERVMQALLRGLRATLVAERVLRRLVQLVEQTELPEKAYERIQQELAWLKLSKEEKLARLAALEKFGEPDFRRLVNLVHELMAEVSCEQAVQAARRYFQLLQAAPPESRAGELARAPELVAAVAGAETREFMQELAAQLAQALAESGESESEGHLGAAACLTIIAQAAGRFEDFGMVQQIGGALERSAARDAARHANCCLKALGAMLPPASAERLVELLVDKRADPASAKTATSLLRTLGSTGAEAAFRALEREEVAATRLQLVRLLGKLGAAAIEATRKRLADERWYVVRNACLVLADLAPLDLVQQLKGALRHADARVEQAALAGIVASKAPERAAVIAEALPALQDIVLDKALDELSYLKDPAAVKFVGQLIAAKAGAKTPALLKAVNLLAGMNTDEAVMLLGQALANAKVETFLRRAAMAALNQSPVARARLLLHQFVRLSPSDPLAAECRKLL